MMSVLSIYNVVMSIMFMNNAQNLVNNDKMINDSCE